MTLLAGARRTQYGYDRYKASFRVLRQRLAQSPRAYGWGPQHAPRPRLAVSQRPSSNPDGAQLQVLNW